MLYSKILSILDSLSMEELFVITGGGAIATGTILGFVTCCLFDTDSTDEDRTNHED